MQNIGTRITATLSVVAIAASITIAGIAGAKGDVNSPGVQADTAYPTHVGRDYPVHIEGHISTGWQITWRDGGTTGLGPYWKLRQECKHDDHPEYCLAIWRQYEWDLGVMRAIIRGR